MSLKRLHRLTSAPGAVDAYSKGRHHAALVRNGYMDRIGSLIGKPL